MNKKLFWIVGISFLLLGPYIGWKLFERNFFYERAPLGAGVGSISYLETKTFGFGPGGNETGVIVFSLSSASADALREAPNEFLEALPKSRDRCSRYSNWKQTPIIASKGDSLTGQIKGEPLRLDSMLNRYGFGIPIRRDIKTMLDQAFANQGSYYGSSRCGLFIFMPEFGKAAYIFVS